MTTEGQRVKEVRDKLNLSQEKFGDFFNIGKSFVSAVEKDKKFLSRENLKILLVNHQVNINYILAGKGSPFLNDGDENSLSSDEIKLVKKFLSNQFNKD
jgi:transcriptional regulator with XRE-family HTH domain